MPLTIPPSIFLRKNIRQGQIFSFHIHDDTDRIHVRWRLIRQLSITLAQCWTTVYTINKFKLIN